MQYTIFRTLVATLLISFSSFNLSAQDLLARQAHTDRHLRAVDSVALRQLRQIESRNGMNIGENDLYTSWSNAGVHVYGNQPLPDTYKIDLRGFVMPTTSRNVTSSYGYRSSFRRNHYGLDIKVYTGDTIGSAWDGKVRVVRNEPSGWGKYVVVRHSNGLETLYAHLSKHLVTENQVVKAGEPIGLGGSTGRSTGSHLHLECRILGEPINPELLFDFPNQDMTGDYYVWHNTNSRRSISNLSAIAENQEKAENTNLSKNESAAEKESGSIQQAERPQIRYHKVRKGETAYSIAKQNGISVEKLLKDNGLRRTSKLRLGQLLKY